MSKLMAKWMHSCKKASELIDKREIVGLSIIEKIQLSMHTSMCKGCYNYQKQSRKLNIFIKKVNENPPSKEIKASDELTAFKNKILKNLENE